VGYDHASCAPLTLAVTSGKGGVGKSNLTLNLAVHWASLGRRVLVFDADLALANIHMLLGLSPVLTLTDCLKGRASLEEIVLSTPEGLDILPAGSGDLAAIDVPDGVREMLIDQTSSLVMGYDIMLVDTAAGLTGNVLSFASACSETLVVTTPDPTALGDAYAMMKLLFRQRARHRARLAVNMTVDDGSGAKAVRGLQAAAKRFLERDVECAGAVPFDPLVGVSVRRQQPFVKLFPRCAASRGLRSLAGKLDGAVLRTRNDQTSWRRRLADMVFGHAQGVGANNG